MHFNDNETLQCPEESPDEQHIRVVIPSNSFEGSYGGAGLRVGQGDGEGETREGAVGGGRGRGSGRLGCRRGDQTYPKCPLWSQSKQLLLQLATILVTMINSGRGSS